MVIILRARIWGHDQGGDRLPMTLLLGFGFGTLIDTNKLIRINYFGTDGARVCKAPFRIFRVFRGYDSSP
jgi:hypothetical protein